MINYTCETLSAKLTGGVVERECDVAGGLDDTGFVLKRLRTGRDPDLVNCAAGCLLGCKIHIR